MGRSSSSGRKGKQGKKKSKMTTNTSIPEGELVDFNFKVLEEFRTRVRMQAMARRMTARALMMTAMEEYFANHPVKPVLMIDRTTKTAGGS
jgi:hypothetical protein